MSEWKPVEYGEFERETPRGVVTVWRGLGGYWRFKFEDGKCSGPFYTREDAMKGAEA
jgi:hypothetical protein